LFRRGVFRFLQKGFDVMKIAKGLALLAAVAMAAQAGAAVRPAAASVQMAPSAMAGMRLGAPSSAKKSDVAGVALLPALLAVGVIAGGVTLAATSNGHSASP
jgi:hypothetical protein